jgi:hypothetical protein
LFKKMDLLFFIACSVYFAIFTTSYFILYWINIWLLFLRKLEIKNFRLDSKTRDVFS